jgi:hypothetical protein
MDELNKDEKNKLITLFRDTNKKEIFKWFILSKTIV